MTEMQAYRNKVKTEFLMPKTKLRQERRKRDLTTAYMASLIGLSNRKGYEDKENGKQPFKDYEMAKIANEFGIDEVTLFFGN